MRNRIRIAVLFSGSGTTMQSVIQATRSGILPYAEVACAIASKPGIRGIDIALAEGISKSDIVVCNPKDFGSREQFGEALIDVLYQRGIDLIVQLGWLPLTPENVVESFRGAIFNQHPGPLRHHHRDFGGKGMHGIRVHGARLIFVRTTGRNYWTEAVCHRVTPQFDEGAVIKWSRVEILPGDNAETLQKRVLPVEHEVQIAALKDILEGNVREHYTNGDHDDLVLPEELPILKEAKIAAIQAWPNG